MKTKKLPLILAEKIVAQSQLFKVQQIKLEFHNGEQRDYERLLGHSGGAVLIVPMLDEHTMLLVREFGMGMGRYELGFPKGKIDPGETWREASARECSEEIGYRPSELHLLDCVSLSAGYMDHQTHLVLAKGLIPEQAEGDEPEPLDIVPWRLDNWRELILQPDFSEGRAYAALFLTLEKLGKLL